MSDDTTARMRARILRDPATASYRLEWHGKQATVWYEGENLGTIRNAYEWSPPQIEAQARAWIADLEAEIGRMLDETARPPVLTETERRAQAKAYER